MSRETQPELRVQFTRRTDGSVVLRCTRKDGSVTWQHHEKHASFFSFHDLRHFAVETTLGLRCGFYGLVADGWDIADTGGKGARGKLSPASILVEHIVGLFERELSGGARPLSAVEFSAQLEATLGIDSNRPQFTDAQLTRVRNRTEELHREWTGVPANSTLDLAFSRD
jgi:hypothetical protein